MSNFANFSTLVLRVPGQMQSAGSFEEKTAFEVRHERTGEFNMVTLNFKKGRDGLLPAIVQDYATKEVLMLAYINEEAWLKTIATGKAHFWSRSRRCLWLKGETSGHVQLIKAILVDCDEDTVIYQVEQIGGAACHTGHRSCFFRRVVGDSLVVAGEKIFDPEKVYGTKQ